MFEVRVRYLRVWCQCFPFSLYRFVFQTAHSEIHGGFGKFQYHILIGRPFHYCTTALKNNSLSRGISVFAGFEVALFRVGTWNIIEAIFMYPYLYNYNYIYHFLPAHSLYSLWYLLIYPPQIATIMKPVPFCSMYNPVSHTESLGESRE